MIAVATIAHKRVEVFELWVKHTLSLDEVVPVVALSCDGTEAVCKKYGVFYYRMENLPLSNKCNARMEMCRHLDIDGVITCGSDDLISQSYIDYILIKSVDYNLINPLDIYYYDTESKQCAYSKGYQNERKGEPLGVGRYYRRDLLDILNWKTITGNWSGSLDRHTQNYLRMYKHHFNELRFRMHHQGVFIVDVKTQENITKFIWRDNYVKISEELFKKLPIWEQVQSL